MNEIDRSAGFVGILPLAVRGDGLYCCTEVGTMAMTLSDYLQLRCAEMLTLTRDCWQLAQAMARECRDPRLKELMNDHSERLRAEVSRLEQAVDLLGGFIGPEVNHVSQGVLHAHLEMMMLNPPPAIVDLHHVAEADQLEHLRMAGNQELRGLACQLAYADIVLLLEENLADEGRACTTFEAEFARLLTAFGTQGRQAA